MWVWSLEGKPASSRWPLRSPRHKEESYECGPLNSPVPFGNNLVMIGVADLPTRRLLLGPAYSPTRADIQRYDCAVRLASHGLILANTSPGYLVRLFVTELYD